MKKIVTRIILAAVCAVLAVTAAAAQAAPPDAAVRLGGDGYDCLYYQCTLPDGRVILSGWKGTPGNWQDSRARILCLNPDMTVSWDYLDPAEGSCGFTNVAVLKDSTLGAVFEDAPEQALSERKLKFFTPDGQPAGEEIDLTLPEAFVSGTCASCLRLSGITSTDFVGWDGSVLLHLEDSESPFRGCEWMAEDDTGLVFAGEKSGTNSGLLMKMDWQGNLVWETVIPASDLPGVEGANLTDCRKTEDGGYLAQLVEYGTEISAYRSLVRFSADGQILWRNAEVFANCPEMWLNRLTVHDGRIVAEMMDEGSAFGPDLRCTYLWTDADGNFLGTTELHTETLGLPYPLQGEGRYIYYGTLISTPEGLWTLGTYESANDDGSINLDLTDEFLARVPVL